MFRTLSLAAALALTVAAANAAQIKIETADYDVTTLNGVDSLQREIVVAGIKVCREEMGVYVSSRRACVRATVDDTVSASNIGPLIEFHFALDAGLRYDPNRPEATVEVVSASR